MIFRSSFVSLVCHCRRRYREGLQTPTGCPLRPIHQPERSKKVGSVPTIPSKVGVICAQNPGGATQTLEARSGHLSRAGRLRDASRCSQTGRRQQPTLVAQLGDGTQHGAAERSLQTAGSPQTCRLTPSRRTVRCEPACRVVWQGTWRTNLHVHMPM
jgi:hypothetical protein